MQDLDVSGLSKALARPTTGATKGVVVVMFYANWCSHCIDTLPVFAAAKEILAATKQGDALVQVDVAKHKQLTQQYDVKAFPTIRAFLQGQPVGPPYAGLRDADDMAKWTREIIATPPPPEEPSPTPTNDPQASSDSSKPSRPMPRAPAGNRRPSKREKDSLPDDEKLANAMKDIGKRMAEREQKRTREEGGDRPDGPDDPDGLDEGWFPMGKRKTEKGNKDAEREAFSTDPLYGHADEF
jgi:thiol-disulfide isomerase/thioredoxin